MDGERSENEMLRSGKPVLQEGRAFSDPILSASMLESKGDSVSSFWLLIQTLGNRPEMLLKKMYSIKHIRCSEFI